MLETLEQCVPLKECLRKAEYPSREDICQIYNFYLLKDIQKCTLCFYVTEHVHSQAVYFFTCIIPRLHFSTFIFKLLCEIQWEKKKKKSESLLFKVIHNLYTIVYIILRQITIY